MTLASGSGPGIMAPHLSRRPVILAGIAAAAIVLCTMMLAPFGSRMGPIIPPVVSIYAVLMSLIEALTAFFLAIQCRSSREPFFGALAGAFAFVAVMVFSQMLVFPGVFSPTGLFASGPQSSIWMWAIWHVGFPAFVLVGLALRADWLPLDTASRQRIGFLLVPAAPLLALALAYLCIAHSGLLPPLIQGGSYKLLRHSSMMAVIFGSTLLALLGCLWITRLRDLLSLWLAVALLASLSDATLTLSGAVRYDIGWYSGRIQSILSSSMIFCVLLFELTQLYDRLVAANEHLAQRAVRDGLTGAFNRGYFDEQFPREMRRAIREATSLSLLLVDVDHFKLYNDLYGHQKGDECLIAIVRALREQTKRPADIAARYGGEEFAVLLPRTDAAGAMRIATEIRAGIARLSLPRGDTPAGAVTVSIGIATLDQPKPWHGAEDLLRNADLALYQAKREGRDTIRAAPAETDTAAPSSDDFSGLMQSAGLDAG